MQWIYWLLAIIIALGAAFLVYRADRKRAVPYPWLTSALRGLVVFLTLILILAPALLVTHNNIEKPTVVLLQDDSRSVGICLGKDTLAYRQHTEELISKLSDKYKVVQFGFGGEARQDSLFKYQQPITDIASALSRVQEYYGMQNLGAIILASDGRINQGVNPLYQQLSLNCPLYTVAIGDSTVQKDIKLTQVYANKTVNLNAAFEIRADVVAELCNGYSNNVELHEGSQVLATAAVSVLANRYSKAVSFSVKAATAGLHHYVLTLPQADGEKNIDNNRKDIFVEVTEEKKNILIISAAPHPDVNAIKEALSGITAYNITTAGIDNIPADLSVYNVLILHSVPSNRMDISPKLLAARKPMWLIPGMQASLPMLNNLRDQTMVSFVPFTPYDAVPVFNTTFTTFTLPRQVQTVADKLPPLSMITGAVNLQPGAAVLFNYKNPANGQLSPMWALQQGNVPVAVLAGEGIWRWRVYEFKNFGDHSVVDECIRQTVTFLAAGNNEKPFSVAMPKYVWRDQEPIFLKAYLLNANKEQINTPDAAITITDSAGNKKDFTLERSGNSYSLNLGIWSGGTYTYVAKTTYATKAYTAAGSFAVETIPVELMEQGADYQLLFGLAHKYSGTFFTTANMGGVYDSISRNANIKPLIREDKVSVPLIDRKWLFFLILLIVSTEWLLRKYWMAQ
jgi:hypothetical protein